MKKLLFHGFIVLLIVFIPASCRKTASPKPHGYLRIVFPKKSYNKFQSDCEFSFEIPVYSTIEKVKEKYAEKCWYNINFINYNATVYLTYKSINKDLNAYVEDIRTIVYKHTIKADDIIESIISIPERKVYGIMYDIKGNAASPLNFFLTDSTQNFLSGSLYFNVQPDKDSLAPAIDFFRKDIIHLIESINW